MSLILNDLMLLKDPSMAQRLMKFFQTHPGGYGEGDQFLGARAPDLRIIAKRYKGISLDEVEKLLKSPYNEIRYTALVILVYKSKKASDDEKKQLFDFYLAHTKYINNWNLIDVTCKDVVGGYLANKHDRSVLQHLAHSKNMWEQRIAIISTFAFIPHLDFKDTIELAKILLYHKHDLIHKAVGWALREVGKKDEKTLLDFLDMYASTMPRTTLRYAIEKLTPRDREHYLGLKQVKHS